MDNKKFSIDQQMVIVTNDLIRDLGIGHQISRQELCSLVSARFQTNKTSIIPSDYCYNRTNKGIDFTKKPRLFKLCDHGMYKCLGAGYPYNGDVYWNAKDSEKLTLFGKWENGVFIEGKIASPATSKPVSNSCLFDEDDYLSTLWHSKKAADWHIAEARYWERIPDGKVMLERNVENLDPNAVANMTVSEFFDFLHDTYFVWKFISHLPTMQNYLKKHLDDMAALGKIQHNLFSFNRADIQKGLEIATKINGLGIAGASGLLSILFPDYFGTVDQFLVKSLSSIHGTNFPIQLKEMKPENLKIEDGILLEKILREKAAELNTLFNTTEWTPRKIDKILWAYRL